MGRGPPARGSLRIWGARSWSLTFLQDDSVDVAGAIHRYEPIPDVAGNKGGIALEGDSVAPSAREAEDDPLPGLYTLLTFGVKISRP
jgi:hypothetical protein